MRGGQQAEISEEVRRLVNGAKALLAGAIDDQTECFDPSVDQDQLLSYHGGRSDKPPQLAPLSFPVSSSFQANLRAV
jgi:hypothetical protein